MSVRERRPRVAVVVPAYNDLPYLIACLESLARADYPELETILVDDGSTDGTDRVVAEHFPWVRRLVGDGNLWWTGAMNRGMRDALAHGADYVMGLNSDVLVAPDAVAALVCCARAHPNAIVGSVIYDADQPDTVWCAGGATHWPLQADVVLGHGQPDRGQFHGVRAVEWLPGMGSLYPRHILEALDFFDRRALPQYYADADLTLRARRRGYQVLVTGASKLYNQTSHTGYFLPERITWRDVRRLLFDLRSTTHVRTMPRFYWRHAPWRLGGLAIAYRYGQVALAIARRLPRSLSAARCP